MATHVYALLSHQMQRQSFVDLQQRLSAYSIASRVIPLPCPQYFYPESIGSGRLLLPKDWLRLGWGHELDVKVRAEEELEDLSITDGLGIEIRVYKHLIIVKRSAGEKWIEFVLDPIRRLSLRQDIQSIASFLDAKQVVYLPGSWLPDLETYTLSQLISELQNQKRRFVGMQTVAKEIQSYQQFNKGKKDMFAIFDQFEHPVTSLQLQSLANLQIAILTLAIDRDDLDYLRDKLIAKKDILQQLELQILSCLQWVGDVKNNVFDEITEEQLLLIKLLFSNLQEYLGSKHYLWLNCLERVPLQKLAEEIISAFAWTSIDINDWIDERL